MADPSGQSFLFSLTNAANKAVRFSLRDKDKAIAADVHGVAFDNFALHFHWIPTNEAEGNLAWPIDEGSAYQPDEGDMDRGVDFFAGSKYFAAADIEVYQAL